MARSEIEQDVGGLPDHELAGFEERRRKRRRAATRLHHLHHRGHAALAARNVGIVGAGLFQREADIFAAALDARPVQEFIAHGAAFPLTQHSSATRGAMSLSASQRSSGSLVRREAVQQAVAAGALEVGLRAAAIRPARGMRAVPGFRGVVVAQADAVGMAEHRRALRAARPVLAGAVLAGRERGAVGLRSRQDVMAVRRIAAAVDDLALLAQRGLLGEIVAAPCRSATSLAITTPLEFCHGPLPMRSRAFTAGLPSAACVER